ncbi:MAG: ABC transporter ATP-binding protein [Gemmatimonadetes bacterium]|nr:ABC transporter ATP-binding protein [Gemmatimonadota bacterium]NNM07265.1 ABC transporter ATP-binding protein [Gemmatimonadota bacterium]
MLLRDVHKAFGANRVLKGFSLEVQPGETLAIVGQSGTGKSVALKHVVGLLRPDRGEVWVDGQNVGDMSLEGLYEVRRNVGYVFQFAALFDSLTIGENVGMGLKRLPEVTEEAISRRVRECLALVELEGYESRYPAQLSGGQKKRAGLARAIATRPEYLLYDEPTTGLDPVTKTVIDRLIIRTREELEVTSVVITHDMESAYRVADRIGMLHDGIIRFMGTADEIQACPDPVVKGFIEGKPELLEGAG